MSIILLNIEILIGAFMHDSIIRPYGGDFLVVILLYCLLKSFFNIKVTPAAISVLLISYAIETLQYLQLIKFLGLDRYRLAQVILGTSFSWIDIIAYTLGILTVVVIEHQFIQPLIVNRKLSKQ